MNTKKCQRNMNRSRHKLGISLTELGPLEEEGDDDSKSSEHENDELRDNNNGPIDDISLSGISVSSSVSSLGNKYAQSKPKSKYLGDEDETSASISQENVESFQRRNSLSKVTDRETIIDSINWLGRHVPQCVIKQLTEEVMQTPSQSNVSKSRSFHFGRRSNDSSAQIVDMEMPFGTHYKAAFLFIDMSGFTKLSQKLDVESFSKVRKICLNFLIHLSKFCVPPFSCYYS